MADETSKEAQRVIELVRQLRKEHGIDEPNVGEEAVPPYQSIIPHWAPRLASLDETTKQAWDERIRRIGAGTASTEDMRVHELARKALAEGLHFPEEAMAMPGPELSSEERWWHPTSLDNPERAVAFGIPPLIAERIARRALRDTLSVRACSRVGKDYLILVLIGDVGCGKTYAAAHWLWTARHEAPRSIRRSVGSRRFLEAPALADIPFRERSPEFGQAIALVIDDCGTEKDFLRGDIARVISERYRNALPTVLTTNLNEAGFNDQYGGRIADRMREVGSFVTVSNSAEDSLRGKIPVL